MSRICRNMRDSGKLRFYELDEESKMQLLKTHSHTSNVLAMEPGKREEKQLKETQTLKTRQTTHQKPVAYRRCVGGAGGQKRLYGEQTTEKALCKPLSKGRGTLALVQGRSHAKNFPRTTSMAGVR